MKKECVFRCRFDGTHFAVYAVIHPKREGKLLYYTYRERRMLDYLPWDSLEGAVGSILLENRSFHMSTFKQVWL